MIVNLPGTPEVVDARISPSRDVISADPTVETACATLVIPEVEFNTADELTFSREA